MLKVLRNKFWDAKKEKKTTTQNEVSRQGKLILDEEGVLGRANTQETGGVFGIYYVIQLETVIFPVGLIQLACLT